MTNLRTNNWKEFLLTDLFDVKGSKTTSLLELEEHGAGECPYVTTKATNNGVDGFYNFYTEEGNVLTVDSAVVGYCSYQPFSFSASDHVEKLIPKFQMNEALGLFLSTIINQEQYRYNYGRKASQNRLREQYIKLPAKNNKPDWEFMEEYMSDINNNIEKPMKNSMIVKNAEYDHREWQDFHTDSIFEDISIAKSIDLRYLNKAEEGVRYVSRTQLNNGVLAYIGNIDDVQDLINKGQCLSVAMVGELSVFYQAEDFFASQNILLLRNQEINKYNAFFVSQVLQLEKYRFSYGRPLSKTFFINDLTIKLPAKNNKPDWEFMEEYIKSLPYSANL